MKSKLFVAAAIAALALGGAHSALAADQGAGVVRTGGWNYYGPGPNYYMQYHWGPNCYSTPHPVYGWICY